VDFLVRPLSGNWCVIVRWKLIKGDGKMNRMICNTSGGKTSMALAVELKQRGYNPICIFANTGLENEETLDFINKCDKHFKLNIVWIEAVVNPIHNKGIAHRETSFDYAYRNHQYKDPKHPYHAFVAKYGIPNATYKQCSDRLKEIPIEHYKRKNSLHGLKHAIGMRLDEPNRVISKKIRDLLSLAKIDSYNFRNIESHEERMKMINNSVCEFSKDELNAITLYSAKKLQKYNLVYPLYDWFPMDKQDVNDWWEDQPFNLELEDYEGNCQFCWKKSDTKLFLIANEHPERLEAMKWFEETYSDVKPNTKTNQRRYFFRKHRSAEMILGEARLYDLYTLRNSIGIGKERYNDSGCSESCDPYSE